MGKDHSDPLQYLITGRPSLLFFFFALFIYFILSAYRFFKMDWLK